MAHLGLGNAGEEVDGGVGEEVDGGVGEGVDGVRTVLLGTVLLGGSSSAAASCSAAAPPRRGPPRRQVLLGGGVLLGAALRGLGDGFGDGGDSASATGPAGTAGMASAPGTGRRRRSWGQLGHARKGEWRDAAKSLVIYRYRYQCRLWFTAGADTTISAGCKLEPALILFSLFLQNSSFILNRN